MRTRNQAKSHDESPGAGDSQSQAGRAVVATRLGHGEGSLGAVSVEAVGRLLKRSSSRKSSGCRDRQESQHSFWELRDKKMELSGTHKRKADEEINFESTVIHCVDGDAKASTVKNEKDLKRISQHDACEVDWEEGVIPFSESREGYSHELGKEVTVEFTESPSSVQRRRCRRGSVEDKEIAELVHKVHLLCLIARGRIVDIACDDPIIQASLLSLLPSNLVKITEVSRLTANMLEPLINWFQNNFQIKSEGIDRGCFKTNLAFALETHEGTSEEVAALSVALFRALNLTSRYVSNLDVSSLKRDVDVPGSSSSDTTRLNTKISSSITAVPNSNLIHTPELVHLSGAKSEATPYSKPSSLRLPNNGNNAILNKILLKGLEVSSGSGDENSTSAEKFDVCANKCNERSNRKGDQEFELQLAMALSATAATVHDSKNGPYINELHDNLSISSPLVKKRKNKTRESLLSDCGSSYGVVWSRKNGPPLHWAEVYCNGETLSGRWVHIDAANGLIDGEEKVEAASAACRRPLRYAVAFAGNGAKDVTRRYCRQWYKISSQRVNSQWWDKVLAPLKELESGPTRDMDHLEAFREHIFNVEKRSSEVEDPSQYHPDHVNDQFHKEASKQMSNRNHHQTPLKHPNLPSRNSLEDMELETRALTEPLPTNQLAYRNHHLYAIEKWLNKYQTLHPKGPVLGFCSGHPVYPRTCVQTVQTKQKWLREGLQVLENETPVKVLKRLRKEGNGEIFEPDFTEGEDRTIELFGRWQLEPLQLPHAVNGIVPKNEYGRVDVWSEKCLPPGTVHLRLPRLASIARRLDIDFALAMVGFEFRNGRSHPVYEGIVVCTEFRDAIMEAYAEEEERREAEERRKNEKDALSRWFQLLSSIVRRQHLEASYVSSSVLSSMDGPHSNSVDHESEKFRIKSLERNVNNGNFALSTCEEHEHIFPMENQSLDEESLIRTKRCPCGFSIELEEL